MPPKVLTFLAPVIRPLLQGFLRLPGALLDTITRGLPAVGRELITPDQRVIATATSLPGAGRSIETARREMDARASVAAVRPPEGSLSISEHSVEGGAGQLRARLYSPFAGGSGLLIWFHGGGWVTGSIESHDLSLRLLTVESGVSVLSVDYRLAPENPWPAAPDDALAAWRHIRGERDLFGASHGPLLVGGDSAGANLATVLCLDLKEAGETQPDGQVLVYPAVDLDGESSSYRSFASGFFLTEEKMEFFKDAYVPDFGKRSLPRVSPVFAESLEGLAPAYICTAAADPLRDEGEAYGELLTRAGVPVEAERFPLIHGWMNMTVSPSARSAFERLAGAVSALAASRS
jgi:acetyl esterase